MKQPASLLLGAAVAAPLAIASPAIAAVECTGFVGPCDPVNASVDLQGGSVDDSGAPAEITFVSNDSSVAGTTSYIYDTSIFAPHFGFYDVSFDWSYMTEDRDGSTWDPFGYVVNGDFIQLTIDEVPNDIPQSGSVAFQIPSGGTFGFYIATDDGLLGPGMATVSNFSVRSVGVPTPLPMLSVAAAFGVSRRLRRRIRTSGPAVLSAID